MQLPRIRTLRVGNVFELTDPFSTGEKEFAGILISPSRIADPRKLFQIETLTFSVGAATDDTLKVLSSLPRLRHLELDDCPISDAGMASLGICHEIKSLSLRNTEITDAGVAQLMNLPELTDLSLTGTKITDRAIDTLVCLRRLENLNIDCAALTDSAVRRLLELPNLRSGSFHNRHRFQKKRESCLKISSPNDGSPPAEGSFDENYRMRLPRFVTCSVVLLMLFVGLPAVFYFFILDHGYTPFCHKVCSLGWTTGWRTERQMFCRMLAVVC